MTPAALRALLAHLLAGASGGTDERWHELIGEVEVLPLVFNPRSNWKIEPRGTVKRRHAIMRAEKVVRAEHPYEQARLSS